MCDEPHRDHDRRQGLHHASHPRSAFTDLGHHDAYPHAFADEWFGGAPRIAVSDQLRSAVRVPSRYEPTIARTYAELGRHYGMAVVPARPGKPRDKAKVEVGVQIAQRWILARLRHETFFSLTALNHRIAELLEELNNRPMKDRPGAHAGGSQEALRGRGRGHRMGAGLTARCCDALNGPRQATPPSFDRASGAA